MFVCMKLLLRCPRQAPGDHFSGKLPAKLLVVYEDEQDLLQGHITSPVRVQSFGLALDEFE